MQHKAFNIGFLVFVSVLFRKGYFDNLKLDDNSEVEPEIMESEVKDDSLKCPQCSGSGIIAYLFYDTYYIVILLKHFKRIF